MVQRKRLVVIVLCLVVFGLVALLGGLLGKKTGKVVTKEEEEGTLRCAYDGTKINPLYEVEAYLSDSTVVSFCSIYCATRWLETNRDRVVYFTVIDEVTGQKFDSSLAHFVESDVVTIPEVNNRVHAFYVKEDAQKHANQFHGEVIENPFGTAFVLPKIAQFEKLTIGAPVLPDAIPLKLAIFRPIFKENRLDVTLAPFVKEQEEKAFLSKEETAGLICDLPTALLLSKGSPSARIVKNVLRANPYRPLYGLVAPADVAYEDFVAMEGTKHIAVPEGVSAAFYADYYVKHLGLDPEEVIVRKVKDTAGAWDLLKSKEVSAALLRTPYTDMAMTEKMTFLADDRNLPWMSVLVLKDAVIQEKLESVKRFIFGLEQSVLALNLKPDEFRTLLREQGGIPKEARDKFPMPIFEGANCPAPDEIAPIMAWLDRKGLLSGATPYKALIDARFLPNPDDVGLAFCCR
jgi:ABC-type nitrate/sulfonate/bicarbonate transport system substrate-binding protein